MSPAKKQDTHAHVPTYHTALTCIPPTSTHSVLSLSLYNPSPTSEHPCLAQCLAQDRHSTKRMEDKTDGGRGGGRQVLVRPLAHRTEDYRFIFVSVESEPQQLLRLSAVGTVRDSLPSSKQRRGHEGRGSPDPHMDSRHLLPFAHTEAGGWGSSPCDCEQPWKLPCQQAVTANRLGPLHPRSCPRSQPRPPARTRWRQVGRSMLPDWGTCYSHRGLGSGNATSPPTPTPGTQGRHPRVPSPTPSCSFTLRSSLPWPSCQPHRPRRAGSAHSPEGKTEVQTKTRRKSPKNNSPWGCLAQWGSEEPRRAEVSVSGP